jgi:hypothetical protein
MSESSTEETSAAFSDGWARNSRKSRRAKTLRPGRPPAGPNGEKTSNYPQLSARLPPETLSALRALSQTLHLPQWRIIADAVDAYYKHRR